MVTAAQLRKLALSLPEAEEKAHFEQPDFRVRGKIFAGLSRDGAQGTLKLTPDLQAAILDAHPRAFSPAAGAWGKSGWTHVHLAHVDLATLKELLSESWELVAPKRMAAARAGKVKSTAPAERRRKPASKRGR